MKTSDRPSIIACSESTTVMLGRAESEDLLDTAQQLRARFFVDPHRPVALNVGVAADGADPRAGPAEIAPQQQQIGDLLHGLGAAAVLGDPHPVADDGGFRGHVDCRHPFDLRPLDPGDSQDILPARGADILHQRVQAHGMLLDEGEVQHGRAPRKKRRLMGLEHELHDALQHRDIAADLDLAILARDPG
jgi:hypothetical protein